MNSADIVTSSDNIMPENVLEGALDEERLLMQGFYEVITERDVTYR
jgi:hypothetical protein